MNGEQKINLITDIKNGIPYDIAVIRQECKFIWKNNTKGFYHANDGTIINDVVKNKYFNDCLFVEYEGNELLYIREE